MLPSGLQPAPDHAETADGQFILDLDGFGGPLDLLLQLARDRKIDLAQLSVAALAEQYIAYIERARHLKLELAADYLVMAAWLAYLKSRLLLPVPPPEEDAEPSPEELAEALAFQLRRLDAMRGAADTLLARPRLGSAVLARGEPEKFSPRGGTKVDLSLHELLSAYAAARQPARAPSLYQIAPLTLDSIESALARLSEVIGKIPRWSVLSRFLPEHSASPLHRRAQVAATFGAGLELVKRGALSVRQDRPFAPVYVRDAGSGQGDAHG